MHLKNVKLLSEKYPIHDQYPFNLPLFQNTKEVEFNSTVTFFVGENGSGKSTILEGLARKCQIHIWEDQQRGRYKWNPHEQMLYRCLKIEWADGIVPGSFFASQIFHHFSELLDEWASADPGVLKYFGGQSLLTQSHGQSLMSFFRSRFQIKGLYLLDEPETALSAKRQLELLQLLHQLSNNGTAQFIIATHSPILLACPNATILSFDKPVIETIEYEQTEHYQIYKDFLNNREEYLP
jgi:predicted ATPase